MKYADIVQFSPIESVVQLQEADIATKARHLVESFVISERMSKDLLEPVFLQLQFATPADNKGLLIVGNYGTGKSHLMAVISAIAEHSDVVTGLTRSEVAEKARSIAGQFVVIRAELSTQMPLYLYVTGILQKHLATHGVSFNVPPEDKIFNHKDVLAEMMAAFTAKFPDKGLLFVLDELLDYLRANHEQELIVNLNFLRSLGEFCKGSRFRFIAGVQESLFDNTRFQFVADSLRRVKDRFEQMRIIRNDVAYVVSERLLKKDAKQQALVREHLALFSRFYGSMNERMDEFVQLFPVHPAFLDTFERIRTAEKREILKTLSKAIERILNQDVPHDEPGLVAYDNYWQDIKNNPSFRSEPDIREVIQKSDVLEAKIQQSFSRPSYRATALKIIHALSVHRLTTDDINIPIGLTADDLRDDLCIFLKLPESDAAFLKTTIETTLKEIVKTVNGQFLSSNSENGQYYLDIKKDIDFDSLIEKRADILDDTILDRYFFDALRQVILEKADATPYVSGHRIWEHELEWLERKAGRSGYLFFGAPNERSTAQPPRDFYIYFIQPFKPPAFTDERKSDEVFFRLTQRDTKFEQTIKLYAGACELANTSSGDNKKIYEAKANQYLRTLNAWFQEHLQTGFQVSYQGKPTSLGQLVRKLASHLPSRDGVRDIVNGVVAHLLSVHFTDRAPDYPIFTTSVTRTNRSQVAQDALRWISTNHKSKHATEILHALEMLDGDTLRPRESRYAKHITEQLHQKGEGQVLNRAELIQEHDGVEYWTRFRLEPEFLTVVLAGLVHSGEIVLHVSGKTLDANTIDQFAKLPFQDIVQFRHIERPQDFPLASLQELLDLLGIPKGLIVNPATRDNAVAAVQAKVAESIQKVIVTQTQISDTILWGKSILSDQEQAEWRQRLGGYKSFLESLQAFNTVGKIKNFRQDVQAIQNQRSGLKLVRDVEELAKLIQQVGSTTSYLSKAQAVLPADHPWIEQARIQRDNLITKLASPKHRSDPAFQRTLAQTLVELKHSYQDVYLENHAKTRLGVNEDQRKARLSQDPRLKTLQSLSAIDMMPKQQLREFEKQLFGLKTCFSLTKPELEKDPICPHCSYRPVEEPFSGTKAADLLSQLDSSLDTLSQNWTQTLLTNLEDPTSIGNIDLISNNEGRTAVQNFRSQQQLPDSVGPELVKALQEVFSGLEKVILHKDPMYEALLQGGIPCTIGEIKQRFDTFVTALTKGKDPTRVRIVMEK